MSTTLSVTRDQVILAAFRKLGIIEPADTIATIDATLVTNASFNLNLIVKHMATKGIKLWTIQEYPLDYVAGTEIYSIYEGATLPNLSAPRPIKLIQAFIRNNTDPTLPIDTPLRLISQQEYYTLGSKQSTGITNSIYMEVLKTLSNVYVWLNPDITTEDNYQLHLIAQRQIEDLTAPSTVMDFPNEWYNCLVWSLADDLAIEFEVPANHRQELSAKAAMYKDELEAWDTEYTSTYFQVDNRASMRPHNF